MTEQVIMVNGEAADVPAILASKWHASPAAGYVTGSPRVQWSERQFADFTRKIRIDQSAGADPAIARIARVKDFETGAGTAADAPRWLAEREKGDQFEQSTSYCSLSRVHDIEQAAAAGALEVPRWWLAWWWNRPGIPTREQVIAELAGVYGVEMDPARLWGCQYFSGPQWELSVIYGTPDFDR